jgi:hypothetical protein
MHLVSSGVTPDFATARLKAIMGTRKASSRSPFIDTPRADLHLSVADFKHHTKHFRLRGAAPLAKGAPAGQTMTASPIEAVLMGKEPLSYLDSFGPDSFWLDQIQQFKHESALKAA